jgi:HK97 family phage portal protein
MALEIRERRRSRTAELVDELAGGARRIARSFFSTLEGPFTSAFIYDEAGVPFSYTLNRRTVLSIGAVYRALAIYADLLGTLPVQRLRGTELLPLPAFVEAPAGIPVGWTDEIGQALWSLLLRGDVYALPTSYDFAGFPATFLVLDPDSVRCEYRHGSTVYSWPIGNAGERYELVDPTPDELLHIRWQRPPGSAHGIGILDSQGGPAGTLTGVIATERYAADAMANPSPPAVLTHPLRLKRSQAEELQAQWSESVARSRTVPAVLSGGITYQPLQLTPRDVELIESRRWNATNVATLFGLPPYMLGGSTGDSLTYSTVEGEAQRLWTMALMPAAVRLERGFGAWTPRGQRLRFVPDALLRSTTLDRYNAHKVALDAGFLTIDEVRDLENRAPLDEPPPPAPPALPSGG